MSKILAPADHLLALSSFVYSKGIISRTLGLTPAKLSKVCSGKALLTQQQADNLHQLLFCNPEINPRTFWSIDAARTIPLPDYTNHPEWRVQPEHLRDYKLALRDLWGYIKTLPGTTVDEKLREFMRLVAPTNKHTDTPKEWFGKGPDNIGWFMSFPTPQMVWEIIRYNMMPQHGTDLMQITKHPLLPTTIYTVDGQHRSFRQRRVTSVDHLVTNHMAQKFVSKPRYTHKATDKPKRQYFADPKDPYDLGLPSRIPTRGCVVFTTYLFMLARVFGQKKYSYRGIRRPGGRLRQSCFTAPFPSPSPALLTPLPASHAVIKGVAEALGSRTTQRSIVPRFRLRGVFTPLQAEKLVGIAAQNGYPGMDYRGLCDPNNPEVQPLPEPHMEDLAFTLQENTWRWLMGNPEIHPEALLAYHPDEDQTPEDQATIMQQDNILAAMDDTQEPEIDPVQAEFPEMEFDDDFDEPEDY